MSEKKAQLKSLTFVTFTRESAARGQLESAILLWFLGRDFSSMHTLAVAALSLLHGKGKKIGKPSLTESWIERQSDRIQKMVRFPQNFFKHATKDPNEKLEYPEEFTEATILDGCFSYVNLHDKLSPMMLAYLSRLALEKPAIVRFDGDSIPALLKRAKIECGMESTREQFLAQFLRRIEGSR